MGPGKVNSWQVVLSQNRDHEMKSIMKISGITILMALPFLALAQDNSAELEKLEAYQRAQTQAADSAATQNLYESGIHSANHIASIPQPRFVRQDPDLLSQSSQSVENTADQVHQKVEH